MESTDFSTMTGPQQEDLVKKVGEVLKDHQMGGINVSIKTEQVCDMVKKRVEKKTLLVVKQEMPQSQKEAAAKFNEAIKPVIDGIKGIDIQVGCASGVAGGLYETIKNVMPINGDKAVDIVHKEGEVLLIDFWASWCPPCQQPMAHNQAMVTKNREKWAGKVRIIGVSSDQDKETMAKHCRKEGWMDVEHYHKHESNCSEVYSITGIPHVIIIDTHGKIAFKQHPLNRKNMEEDLNTLLRGETIEAGKGTTAEVSPNSGKFDKTPEGFKTLDFAAVVAEMAKLKPVMEGMNQDMEMTKLTSAFMQAFCVLVLEMRYCPNTGEFLGKYENYRIFQGPKDSLWKLKACISDRFKGTFVIVQKERAIDDDSGGGRVGQGGIKTMRDGSDGMGGIGGLLGMGGGSSRASGQSMGPITNKVQAFSGAGVSLGGGQVNPPTVVAGTDDAIMVEDEPSDDIDASLVVVLQLRMPNGSKLQRKFLRTNTFGDVIQYVKRNYSGVTEVKFMTAFPKKVFEDASMTLDAAKFGKREALNVDAK